ncbi:MAG: tetratricopeptide repeat protein, partial [Leptospirales bacterium]
VQRRDADALRCFRKAIRLNPRNGDLFNDCGAVLLRMGKLQESVKWFLRALKSTEGAKHHLALFNLAIVYRRWNRPERSRRYLNLAVKLRPDFERARALLAEIRTESQTVN